MDRLEQALAALQMGQKMRKKQRLYFSQRNNNVLQECRILEKQFDVAVEALLAPTALPGMEEGCPHDFIQLNETQDACRYCGMVGKRAGRPSKGNPA